MHAARSDVALSSDGLNASVHIAGNFTGTIGSYVVSVNGHRAVSDDEDEEESVALRTFVPDVTLLEPTEGYAEQILTIRT